MPGIFKHLSRWIRMPLVVLEQLQLLLWELSIVYICQSITTVLEVLAAVEK